MTTGNNCNCFSRVITNSDQNDKDDDEEDWWWQWPKTQYYGASLSDTGGADDIDNGDDGEEKKWLVWLLKQLGASPIK